MVLNMFARIKNWWQGKLVASKYYPDSGLLVLPYEDRPRFYLLIKVVQDFLRTHWKYLVTTIIAVAAILASRR